MSDKISDPQRVSRRSALKAAGRSAFAAGLAATYIPAHAFGKMEKPALGAIGTGGKGRSDISGSESAGFSIAALVDVVDSAKMGSTDERRMKPIAEARSKYSAARFFTDYREMLSEMGDKVDAVTVATPDHHHFHASLLAMQSGKHVYCQKPLTHGIWEARTLARLAAETGVKTQMGNQAHAKDHMRRCVELTRAGVVGRVHEIHAWTNRPIWPQGFAAVPDKEPVPAGIDWEQWIGPAPFTDYSSRIMPFAWRGWWDFGTGALGDMACHIMDMGYWAMGLPAPRSVTARQQGATELSPPINSVITWDFGPNEYSSKKGFRYHWYDGYVNAKFARESWSLVKDGDEYNHPDEDILDGLPFKDYGSVVIGDQGKLFFNRDRDTWVVKPSSVLDGTEWPAESISRAGGDPYREWMDAITGRIDQAESHFGQSGPLTETVLLGVLAQRVPDTLLNWNAEQLTITDRPDLQSYIRREYRPGWQVKV
ncbi:MAG: Gfo/Idh/MocA family oxidoreductase [Planctomycetaceae bacterium]|nr:Gfo/Idh/MocA family oxidoreductase [Planctomycetaceae bacterium]